MAGRTAPTRLPEEPKVETWGDLLRFRRLVSDAVRQLPEAEQEEGKRILQELDALYLEGTRGTRRLTESSLRLEKLTWVLVVLTGLLSILTAALLVRTW